MYTTSSIVMYRTAPYPYRTRTVRYRTYRYYLQHRTRTVRYRTYWYYLQYACCGVAFALLCQTLVGKPRWSGRETSSSAPMDSWEWEARCAVVPGLGKIVSSYVVLEGTLVLVVLVGSVIFRIERFGLDLRWVKGDFQAMQVCFSASVLFMPWRISSVNFRQSRSQRCAARARAPSCMEISRESDPYRARGRAAQNLSCTRASDLTLFFHSCTGTGTVRNSVLYCIGIQPALRPGLMNCKLVPRAY